MENEKPNGKDREKVKVSPPDLDLGLKQPEQHTVLTREQAVCAKNTTKPQRDYLCHSSYILILSSHSDSNKRNHAVSCYPLKLHVLITEIQRFHPSAWSQHNIRPPSADY